MQQLLNTNFEIFYQKSRFLKSIKILIGYDKKRIEAFFVQNLKLDFSENKTRNLIQNIKQNAQ